MASQDVCLISRYDERESEVIILGIADCRFRADRMVSNDIDTMKAVILRNVKTSHQAAWEIRQEKDQTLVLFGDLGLVLTYTFTEVPMNEPICLPEF